MVHFIVIASALPLVLAASGAQAQNPEMSFFITSQGPGNGGDLGGLEGADAHCQQLAESVAAGGKTWRAYLSTGEVLVGHHDRIGLRDDAPSKSWNASHPSRGCSQEALRQSGGDGPFYCFATD